MDENEILPAFIFSHSKGEVSDHSSLIKVHSNLAYVSINSTVNVFDIRRGLCLDSLTDHKAGRVTAFAVCEFLCAGYENGVIKIFENGKKLKQFRPHSKRVTDIRVYENFLLSSSADGTLIKYDLIGDEVKMFYKGTKSAIYNIKVDGQTVASNSADNVMRYWGLDSEDCLGVVPCDSEVLDFVLCGTFFVIFYCNGESIVVDVLNKSRKKFNTFKKIRYVKKYEDRIYVLSKGKLMIYRISVKDELILQDIGSYKVDKYYHAFDINNLNEVTFVSDRNKLVLMNLGDLQESKISFHENEIFDILVQDKKVVTCSEEKYIVWKIRDEGVEKVHTCELDFKATKALLFGRVILVSSPDSIYFFDLKNNNLLKRVEVPNKVIHLNRNTLFVANGAELVIYNVDGLDIKEIKEIRFHDEITCINSSGSQLYYGIAFLDNTLQTFDFMSHEHRISLYGHSLPVRYFTFSPNSTTILTCGADKLVKLWGAEFGECRKSFIGDAWNASYVTNKGFLFCDDAIKYYKKHECIKQYKGYNHKIVCYADQMLIVGLKYGFKYFKTGQYEIDEKYDDSEDIEEEILKEQKITDYRLYERLVKELGEIEMGQKGDMEELYGILRAVNLAEIDKFIYFLTESHVKIVLRCLKQYYELFPVSAIRIFINIGRIYSFMCKNDKEVYELFVALRSRMIILRDEVGTDMLEATLL